MVQTNKRFRTLPAALVLSLSLLPCASALDFDGGTAQSFSSLIKSAGEPNPVLKAPVASTAPVSSELARFWEDLKRDTLDSICKSAEIKLNEEGKLDNVGGVGVSFKRAMRRGASQKIYLLDEVGLKLSLGIGQEVLSIPNIGPLGVSLTGLLEGKSQVVRPLESDRYCKELGTLVKLYKVKTVIPATARRVSEMGVGEIWKLPLTLRLGFGMSVGTVISEVVNVSISAGTSKESRPSVSLNRLSDDKLRLRLRLDRITARSVGASVSSIEIPMADIGLIQGENIIAKAVNRAWAKEINEYLAAKLSYGYTKFAGKKLLLEFILNPNDAEQMASLEKFLQGDYGVLKRFIEMGLRFNNFREDDETNAGFGEIAGAADQAGAGMNADSSFAGSNIYNGHTNNFNIQVPIVHKHENSWTSSYNRYQSLENQGEVLHVRQETRVSNGSSLNIPFVGKVMKYDSQKNVYVVNKETSDGKVTRPVFLYQQYEGFVKRGDGTARGMLDKANGVLRYVGMNGDGVNDGNTLPSTEMFPPLPEETDSDGFTTQPSKTYKAAVMSFKLLINERGVQDIIFAPAQAIMKAYMNMMREAEGAIIEKVMDLFTINKDGKVDYDWKAAEKRLGVSSFDTYENSTNPMDIVRNLAYVATRVIRDMVSVKEASNWKEQSERLSKVAAGSGKSGLKYEEFLKVVVQLVNPDDVSAEVYLHTDKRVKGEADVTQNYQFFNSRDNNFDNTIAEVNQMRERFAAPSELAD
ncbi:MAG TPA: hypothetical protein DCZ92_08965 [Elusimicrobia bacterium]|nr:MAG: hypothetical protein A2016_09380 [Elusimicrobia bacterium GWF2_62_30]HBA60936.1 hypothetical protein [Elusimicrobiota bacterium]